MFTIDPQLLINAGLFLGGLFGGAYSALKIRSLRNGNGSGGSSIEKSKKTSGALHISEEGLQKVTEIRETLKSDYLTKDKHTDICGKMQADIKLYISDELKEHTKQILEALKKNGYSK